MQAPGFWDDQERASKTSSAHKRAQDRLQTFRAVEADAADLPELAEMAAEDPEIASELESQLETVESRLATLEESRLFRGEYDSGDAVVTVRSGAGGTDSQDWAEMLLRMYLRWAERRGFQVEMKEASEGEEAGIKSATFIARGENGYGLFAAERGVHRLVRISPFDAQKRRHTAFAQVDVAPLVDDEVEVEIEDEEMAAELATQLASIEGRLAELEEARLFSGEYDAGDAVVTVHAGAGGTDSQDWAEIQLRMYLRWAERRGFEIEMKEASAGEEAGLKSATFIARGENAYGLFAAERGVHRLVRISPFDSSARRHTSFAQVDVGPLVDEGVEVEIDDTDLRVDTYRASGAGGQHVNKTDSAVRITHIPTGVVVQCQNERSQIQNRAVAMQLLRSKLIELEERKRAETLAKERGEVKDVAWGSQIRSYFLHPDQRVKDHRTGHESGDTQGVLDGDIDDFIRDYLNKTAS